VLDGVFTRCASQVSIAKLFGGSNQAPRLARRGKEERATDRLAP
jgi:hypothetical protein